MSRATDAAVGMMDSAYFVGRKELLDFFNDLLDLNLAKIEETASGAIACQITDLIFPGSIQLSRIHWGARSDYEFVQNYKILQKSFTQNRVQRHVRTILDGYSLSSQHCYRTTQVDVDKLIRAKYQDNLEFCQWLKAFYEQAGSPMREEYDACAIRERGKEGKQYNAKMGRKSASAPIKRGATVSRPVTKPKPTTRPTNPSSRPAGGRAAASTARSTAKAPTAKPAASQPLKERTVNPPAKPKDDGKDKAIIVELEALNTELVDKTEELTLQNNELVERSTFLEQAVLETEAERDFYFEKLRNVEVLLQIKGETSDNKTLLENVFKILYATKEEDVIVTDEGEVVPVDGAETSVLLDDGVASEDADAISLGDVIDG